jgi:Flp pilus assembly protein CpaB
VRRVALALILVSLLACHHAPTTSVVVANRDIPAHTPLDPLLAAGDFRLVDVPSEVVVNGAITSLEQLRGATTTAAIFANEQIPTSRLTGIP